MLFGVACAANVAAQATYTYTDSIQWKAYDDFNAALLDVKSGKYIYLADTKQPKADHRGNGFRDKDVSGCAAAIWCQAIYYDMVVNAYQRAVREDDKTRQTKYKQLHSKIYNGMKNHYVNFNFDNCNTNNGWFVYDDIMWWTCALARANQAAISTSAQNKQFLTYSEKSFLRVWYGSSVVGDDGSYADPARFSGKSGGGMFWEWQPIDKPKPHQPGDFRSACINFPSVIAACLLHQLVPEDRTAPTAARPTQQTREWYLEKAKEVYTWAKTTLVQNGRVADGIHGGAAEFSNHLYNQATYIGASCLLYQITKEEQYLKNALQGAQYTYASMCTTTSHYLPYETGYEQGVYAAIFAQYMRVLMYECDLETYNPTYYKRFMTWMQTNIQKAWDNRDQTRNLSNGKFNAQTPEGDCIESYGGSGMPALMLMFPAGDSQVDAIKDVKEEQTSASNDVYSIDGKLMKANSSAQELSKLDKGLYIYQNKKVAVNK